MPEAVGTDIKEAFTNASLKLSSNVTEIKKKAWMTDDILHLIEETLEKRSSGIPADKSPYEEQS